MGGYRWGIERKKALLDMERQGVWGAAKHCLTPGWTASYAWDECLPKYVIALKGRAAMQVNLPPDLEELVNKRLSSGGYTSVEEVFRRALEAQDAEESWTVEERKALTAHIEEGFLQAERGQLIDGAQVRHEIEQMKDAWRQERQ
jgi:Arc/MetJ-type ribon-helix-helix transcriptional regulator